jgi:gluconate 2-dehydrogenase gamma chain
MSYNFAMTNLTRRSIVAGLGAAGVIPTAGLLTASAAAASAAGATPPAHTDPQPKPTYLFFNAAEVLFIEAAVERLIPADGSGPGALGVGVPNYLDKQLGGAWGAGERLYRSGPWQPGTASQGYQLPFTPAELFRTCLRAIQKSLAAANTPFHEMSSEAQDDYLKSLESGAHELDGVPSGAFFAVLHDMTVEGFFSDPVYGGNRDMAAWRMIGFPGAYADYYEAVDRQGVKFEAEPISLGEDGAGHIHMRTENP